MDWTQSDFCVDNADDVSYQPVSPSVVVKLQNKVKELNNIIEVRNMPNYRNKNILDIEVEYTKKNIVLENKVKEQQKTIKDMRSFMNDFIKYHRDSEKRHSEVNRLINQLDMKIPTMFANHILNKE